MAQDLTAAVRFERRDKPIRVPAPVPEDQTAVALVDSGGVEHHFGGRRFEDVGGERVAAYQYVASYSPEGRVDLTPSEAEGRLRAGGVSVTAPANGPWLQEVAALALESLLAAGDPGVAPDKDATVRTFLALRDDAGADWDPAEVEVWAATRGWSVDDARKLADLSERVRDGRRFRPAIGLEPGEGRRMVEGWTGAVSGSS